jgi:hypothetical protein
MKLRLIPRVDCNPKFVEQAQTPAGKLSLLFLFVLPLWLLNTYWREVALILLAVTFLPRFRRPILAIAAPALAILRPGWIPLDSLSRIAVREHLPASFNVALVAGSATAVVLLGLALAGSLVFHHRKAWFLKRPLVLWHGTFCVLVLAVATLPLSGVFRVCAWAVVFALSGYFWYFCYTITDRTAGDRDPLSVQEGTWRPAWTIGSGTSTPFVKGAAYLRHIEAKTAEDLAITQLKGIKLIWWCTLLRVVLAAMNLTLHGDHAPVPVPRFDIAFAASISGHPFPVALCWASLVCAFLESVLTMSIWGHQIVACCRMAGFRALRNTWRPLEARTIAEFWNRYYFYFKELLVDVFFYPTFLRYFRTRPRLRRFAATFTAAAFGNMLFHFFRDIFYCAELGVWKAILGFRVYAAYSVVLGTAIGVSQLRSGEIRSGKPKEISGSWFRHRLWPGICVGGFYCFLHIFDDTSRNSSLSQHFRFVADLLPFGR